MKKSILNLGKKLSSNELKNITGSFNDPDEYGLCRTRFGFFCGVPDHICCNFMCVLPTHGACKF
ncbi:hypothetical protein [uncultured Tenacibaculum sp.]|uniref:hypothetical protein n=1 Tax=uncultured Tenacibaculum sp. TaxID=174713 RepID=UPI002628651C|nr:hypothetical protein [uncultured Tenacibaculum sp.]